MRKRDELANPGSCLNDDAMTDAERLETARSALKTLLVWATFEHNGLPAGHALVPEHVEKLCEETLRETSKEKTP